MEGFGKRFGESYTIDCHAGVAEGSFYRIVGRRELIFQWKATRYVTRVKVSAHWMPGGVEHVLHTVKFFSTDAVEGNPRLQKLLDAVDEDIRRRSKPSVEKIPDIFKR